MLKVESIWYVVFHLLQSHFTSEHEPLCDQRAIKRPSVVIILKQICRLFILNAGIKSIGFAIITSHNLSIFAITWQKSVFSAKSERELGYMLLVVDTSNVSLLQLFIWYIVDRYQQSNNFLTRYKPAYTQSLGLSLCSGLDPDLMNSASK